MKRIVASFIAICGILVLMCVSCAKEYGESANIAFKRAFDAWMAYHHPDRKPIGDGIYILKDIPGTGEKVRDNDYVFIEYIYKTLEDSVIVAFSDVKYAKQLGTYSKAAYYGPFIFRMAEGSCTAGMKNVMCGGAEFDTMRVGGYRKAVIPGWLSGATTYHKTPQEYLDKESGTNYTLEVRVVGKTTDIVKWQKGNIEEYLRGKGLSADTTSLGIYYNRDKARERTRGVTVKENTNLRKDTTIYINYIGRLLNGQVFDTNIKDTAKVHGLYSSSNTYEPASIQCSTDSTKITMTSQESSIIKGFAWTIWAMHPFESGTGIFTSNLGYGASGSGITIPEYAPLIFEIDIVKQ